MVVKLSNDQFKIQDTMLEMYKVGASQWNPGIILKEGEEISSFLRS